MRIVVLPGLAPSVPSISTCAKHLEAGFAQFNSFGGVGCIVNNHIQVEAELAETDTRCQSSATEGDVVLKGAILTEYFAASPAQQLLYYLDRVP